MNVSIAVFDVGVWVNVHPTFAHNIFMLCAMVLVARLCTGEGGSQRVALTVLCIWQEAGCFSLLGLCTYVVGLFVGRFHMKFGQFSLTRMNDLQGCVGNVTYVIDPTVWFVLAVRLECVAHLDYVISWTQCCAQNTVDSFFITQLNSDTAAYVKYVLRLRV